MDLPELALIELFNSLPVYALLKFRSVCKRWKAIGERQLSDRNELVLFYWTYPRKNLIWFHSERPVDLLGSVIVNEKFEKSPLLERLFKGIKGLYLICHFRDLFKSNFKNFVDRFRHLEHLQVDTLADPVRSIFQHRLQIRLNLPNLRSFCFNTTGRTQLFQVNCPKLEKLSVFCHLWLDEKCASFRESLKFLRVASFECAPGFEFPNLEVLCCQNVWPVDISAHNKLKEIRYIYEHSYFVYDLIDRRMNRRSYPRTAVNEILEEKRWLGRNELQVYYLGIRCSLGPPEIRLKEAYQPGILAKSDLNLLLHQNGEDFKIEDQHWRLWYKNEFDEDIAALGVEQIEKLARCLTLVDLSCSIEFSGKHKILFNYVQELWISNEIQTQSDLDGLPVLFPNLVELIAVRPYAMYHETRNLCQLNFRFLTRFKALHKLKSDDSWKIPQSELNEIMGACRFLEDIELYSLKREELENGQIRTTLVPIRIHLVHKIFPTNAYEYVRSELAKLFGSKEFS